MSICIHIINTMVDVPVCMSIEDIRAATSEDTELQILQAQIRKGCPQTKDKIEPCLGMYWPIRQSGND